MTSPFRHEPRRTLTGQQFAQVFAACDGKCASCHKKLRPGDRYDADHIIALENGGSNDVTNFQILCSGCHAIKTRDDHGTAGHLRRAYTRHVVPGEYRRSRSWGKR